MHRCKTYINICRVDYDWKAWRIWQTLRSGLEGGILENCEKMVAAGDDMGTRAKVSSDMGRPETRKAQERKACVDAAAMAGRKWSEQRERVVAQ